MKTVKQVIEELSKLPQDMEVWMPSNGGEFSYAPVETIEVTTMKCCEDEDDAEETSDTVCYVECVMLREP